MSKSKSRGASRVRSPILNLNALKLALNPYVNSSREYRGKDIPNSRCRATFVGNVTGSILPSFCRTETATPCPAPCVAAAAQRGMSSGYAVAPSPLREGKRPEAFSTSAERSEFIFESFQWATSSAKLYMPLRSRCGPARRSQKSGEKMAKGAAP